MEKESLIKEKPVIMQHYCSSQINNGGPFTGLKLLMESSLTDRFQFVLLPQHMQFTSNFSRLIDLIRQIRKVKPSIVHVRGLQSEGFIGLLAARIAGCNKVVVSVHGSAIDLLKISKVKLFLYQKVIEPITLRNADLVYCVCDYASKRNHIKDNAKNLYGYIHNIAPEFSKIDHNSLRKKIREELCIEQTQIVITYVGRIVKDKGLEYFAEAIKLLEEKQKLSVRYLFVGEGEYLKFLNEKLNKEVNENKVSFLGKRSDVFDILYETDIFVFPTLHENLSNSLLEACSAGLAIVATDVGGNPEVIQDNVTGLLVPSKDSLALADAIQKLVLNPTFRLTLGKNALENVKSNFNAELIINQLGEVYDSLLKKK